MADPKTLEALSADDRQALALGKLGQQLLKSSDAGVVEGYQRLLTKADPNLKFPAIEARDALAKHREETAEALRKQTEENTKLRAELRQEKLHKKVSDAGLELKDVVALLEKHGMPSTEENYDMAIEVLQSRAASTLAESSSGDFQPLEVPDNKGMWENPSEWRQNEAAKVIKEFGGVRRLIQ